LAVVVVSTPGFGGAVAGGLLGRREELAAVVAFLDALAAGPRALLITGDAGIGKTRLWLEGVGRARERGGRVLVARPSGSEVRLSFAALADLVGEALGDVMGQLRPPRRRALEGALLLADVRGAPPDRLAVGLAVGDALRALARSGPVVLAVDDLPWLDPPSGGALAFALRRLHGERIGVLATARISEDEPPPLGLEGLLGEGRLARLALGPLSLGAVHQLLRARLGMMLARPTLVRLHELSAGNPFFVLELARLLQRRGLELAPGEPLPLPGGLRQLVAERLGVLSARARETLSIAAALSQPTVTVVERAAPDPARAARDLEEAEAAGVIEIDGDRLRFAHPLLASVAYSGVSARGRRRVHRCLAEVVVASEERARHLALAADAPDRGVAVALDAAAESAAHQGAPESAAELLELAVRLTAADDGEAHRRRMLAAGRHHLMAGSVAKARALFAEALAQLPSPGERAQLLAGMAFAGPHDVDTAIALCREAVGYAGADDARVSEISRLLAMFWMSRGDVERGLTSAREAVSAAERTGAAALLAPAFCLLAQLETWAGRRTPGVLERAFALAEQCPGLTAWERPDLTRAYRLMYEDRLEPARAGLEHALEQAAAEGNALVRVSLLTALVELECRAGDHNRAAAYASDACERADQLGLGFIGCIALYASALVNARLGRVDQARADAQEGAAIAEEARSEFFELQNLAVLGFLELSLGDAQAAARRLVPLSARLVALGWCEPTLSSAWPDAIEALIATGESVRASALLAEYERLGRAAGSAPAAAHAARVRGLVHAADSNFDAALAALERALTVATPFERGRALLAAGTVQRRAKHRRAARESLGHALALFDELGATLWSDKAQTELNRIGGRTPRSPALTPTELQIATLAAHGKANKEIAAALFITVRTVEWNLSKIYRKLGVRSRSALAHRLDEPASRP
jgi:DNA-binding CsgD family transcriptional regulator